jgi:hypothetical protein
MAEDNFWDKKWEDRSAGGKWLYGGLAVTATPFVAANEARKMWTGDKSRLSEIEKQAAELENSEFNTAKETQKMEDYYDQVFLNAAKAQREAEYGFSPEQKAEARQTFAEGSNLAMQNAQNAGGGTLQNYINANMNTNVNKFATGMASQDAALKMQKQQQVLNYLNQLGSAAGNSQNVFTQNFNKNIMAEQAIGQAERDWYTKRDADRMALVNAGTSVVGQAAGAAAAASDIRLKKNIVYSHTENGHKIYEFEYKNEPNVKYSGVMAQEVLETNPSAVVEENGYYKVYYDMLGLTMKKLN